jgi:hypothetical protein
MHLPHSLLLSQIEQLLPLVRSVWCDGIFIVAGSSVRAVVDSAALLAHMHTLLQVLTARQMILPLLLVRD